MTRSVVRGHNATTTADAGGPPVEPSLVTSAALGAECWLLQRWQRAIKMKYFYRPNPEPGTRHQPEQFHGGVISGRSCESSSHHAAPWSLVTIYKQCRIERQTKVGEVFTITEKAPTSTRALSRLKAPNSAFTFKIKTLCQMGCLILASSVTISCLLTVALHPFSIVS